MINYRAIVALVAKNCLIGRFGQSKENKHFAFSFSSESHFSGMKWSFQWNEDVIQ